MTKEPSVKYRGKRKNKGYNRRPSQSPTPSFSLWSLQQLCIAALSFYCLLHLHHFSTFDDADDSDDDFIASFRTTMNFDRGLEMHATTKFYDNTRRRQFHDQLDRWGRSRHQTHNRRRHNKTEITNQTSWRDDWKEDNGDTDLLSNTHHHHNHPHRINARVRRRHEKTVTTTAKDLKLPTPIIVMGFPKAATSSIFAFFQRQGLRSQHWYCCGAQKGPNVGGPSLMVGCLLKNLRHNTTMMKGCGKDIDVFAEINGPRKKKTHPLTGQTGWLLDDGSVDFLSERQRIFFPQHHRIHEIHQSYPNATWILNWRDTESWINSVINWGDDLQYQFAHEYYMQGDIDSVPQNATEMRTFLRRMYLEHFDMVRDFVNKNPSHTLVEVNITSPDAGQVLADAFGLDPAAWSNENKNQKGMSAFDRLWRRRVKWQWAATPWLLILMIGTAAYMYRKIIPRQRYRSNLEGCMYY